MLFYCDSCTEVVLKNSQVEFILEPRIDVQKITQCPLTFATFLLLEIYLDGCFFFRSSSTNLSVKFLPARLILTVLPFAQ